MNTCDLAYALKILQSFIDESKTVFLPDDLPDFTCEVCVTVSPKDIAALERFHSYVQAEILFPNITPG